jgi:hypothetical protein
MADDISRVDLANTGRPPLGWFRVLGLNTQVPSLASGDDIEAARLLSGLDDAFALIAAGHIFRREVYRSQDARPRQE